MAKKNRDARARSRPQKATSSRRRILKQKEAEYLELFSAQGRIDEAIGAVTAVHRAFVAAQSEEGRASPKDVEDEISALGIGVKELRRAFEKLSLAVLKVMP